MTTSKPTSTAPAEEKPKKERKTPTVVDSIATGLIWTLFSSGALALLFTGVWQWAVAGVIAAITVAGLADSVERFRLARARAAYRDAALARHDALEKMLRDDTAIPLPRLDAEAALARLAADLRPRLDTAIAWQVAEPTNTSRPGRTAPLTDAATSSTNS